jgi:UDP-N-acetylmuramate: L-alanyl-gamma-D-glutamyl-meso-diaminopimelate ligase
VAGAQYGLQQRNVAFEVLRDKELWGEFQTPLLGEFNLLNCLAVIVAADAWGVSKEKIRSALASFKNVKRRAEVRGEERGVVVIDDFAHHPTAVRETLRALRARYQDRRLIAVFEPRSWSSRLAVFQDDYANAFASADYVVIAAVFDSQKVTEKGRALDTRALIDAISRQGKPALALPDADQIVAHIVPELRSGDVVAIMSNGGFGGIHEKILSALRLN